MTNRNEHVERLVRDWVLTQALSDVRPDHHLFSCDEVTLSEHTVEGNVICDTGCDHISWAGAITCPHGERFEFSGGEFGSLDSIIEDLEQRDLLEREGAERR